MLFCVGLTAVGERVVFCFGAPRLFSLSLSLCLVSPPLPSPHGY
ncbi:MAG: hypothetical protein RR253_02050 [Oscillospiraceae bacterium]